MIERVIEQNRQRHKRLKKARRLLSLLILHYFDFEDRGRTTQAEKLKERCRIIIAKGERW